MSDEGSSILPVFIAWMNMPAQAQVREKLRKIALASLEPRPGIFARIVMREAKLQKNRKASADLLAFAVDKTIHPEAYQEQQ